MAMVNTGLGWECPSEYLVYAADTDLGYAQNRDYYKKNDGYAAAMFMYDTAKIYFFYLRSKFSAFYP